LPVGRLATATTPSCPRGRLVFGGFSTSPAGSSLLADGYFNASGGWSASAMNQFGPAASLTSYGYCLNL
jgi:hypothetical protein